MFIIKKLLGLVVILFIISLFFGVYTVEGISVTQNPPMFVYNRITKNAIMTVSPLRYKLKLFKNGDYFLGIKEETYKSLKNESRTISTLIKNYDNSIFQNSYFIFKNIDGVIYFDEADFEKLSRIGDQIVKEHIRDIPKYFKSKDATINLEKYGIVSNGSRFKKANIIFKMLLTTVFLWVKYKVLLIVLVLAALIIRKKLS